MQKGSEAGLASDEEGKFLLMGVDFSVHDRKQKRRLTMYHAKPGRSLDGWG